MLTDIVCFCCCYYYCTLYELEKGFGNKRGIGILFLPSQADLNYVHTFLCLKEKRTQYLVSCYISNVPVLRSSLLTVTTCVGSSYSHLLIRHYKRASPQVGFPINNYSHEIQRSLSTSSFFVHVSYPHYQPIPLIP